MLKAVGKSEHKLGKGLAELADLCAPSTVWVKYLTSQVFFVRSLCTRIAQFLASYEQLFGSNLSLLSANFYTLSTALTNNTTLISRN